MRWMRGPGMPFDKPRSGLPLVIVAAERRLIGYGGNPLGSSESWAFSMKDDAWSTLVLGVTPPPGRTGHCAVHLPPQNAILYVGGHDEAGPAMPPALSFTVGTPGFTDLEDARYAPTEGCAAAYIDTQSRAVIFGGQTALGPSGSTWLVDGSTNTFTQATPASSPPARRGGTLVTDSGASSGTQLVLFGGTNGMDDLADVWLWNGTTWGEVGTSADPQARATDEPRPLGRSNGAVALDPTRRLLYVFGGERQGQLLDDLWRLDLRSATWQRLDLDPRPPARKDASVAYDGILDRLLLFGGQGPSTALSDGWVLSPAS